MAATTDYVAGLDDRASRRFSAILLRDTRFATTGQIAEVLKLRGARERICTDHDWTIEMLTAEPAPSLPGHRRLFEVPLSDEVHLGRGPGGLVLIAAPYVRMLDILRARLGVDASHVLSARLMIPEVFDLYERHSPGGLHVSQIVFTASGMDLVEKVSIAGKNPLRARVHKKLLSSDASSLEGPRDTKFSPYGAALRVSGGRTATAVHADRLGNYYWYLNGYARLSDVSLVLRTLELNNLFASVPGWPPRADPDQ